MIGIIPLKLPFASETATPIAPSLSITCCSTRFINIILSAEPASDESTKLFCNATLYAASSWNPIPSSEATLIFFIISARKSFSSHLPTPTPFANISVACVAVSPVSLYASMALITAFVASFRSTDPATASLDAGSIAVIISSASHPTDTMRYIASATSDAANGMSRDRSNAFWRIFSSSSVATPNALTSVIAPSNPKKA